MRDLNYLKSFGSDCSDYLSMGLEELIRLAMMRRALLRAEETQAHIYNFSWVTRSPIVNRMVMRLISARQESLFVLSAGNDDATLDGESSPDKMPFSNEVCSGQNVICVAASQDITHEGAHEQTPSRLLEGSNRGPLSTPAAPGVFVDQRQQESEPLVFKGASIAAPRVARAAGIFAEKS